MSNPRSREVATALETRFPTLLMKRWGEKVAGFGHTPVQAEGTLGARPFYFRYRHDNASLAVWPTGTQIHSYAALPAGEALVKVYRHDITGDPYCGDLTAEQMIATLGTLLDEVTSVFPAGEDTLSSTTATLPARLTTAEEARAFTDPFDLEPESFRAVTHPDVVPADVARTVVVDCASTAEFTADAVGLVAERLDLRFNRITLVNATMELTEAFTEQSVESAVRARHDQFFAELLAAKPNQVQPNTGTTAD